jgi:sugar phosphate isomerase/epimerase
MIALSTGSLHSYGVARVFELAAQVGYDGIEVVVDSRWDSRQPAYLRRLSADYDLPIVALHSPFLGDVTAWPDDQLGRLKRTVTLSQQVGVSLVVTHLPLRFGAIVCQWGIHQSRSLWLLVPILRRGPYYDFLHNDLAEFEAEAGITIAVENMPLNRRWGLKINRFWLNGPASLERLPHLTLDTTHLGTWGLDPLTVYEQLRERVAHVHLSNFDGKEHCSPPDGRLPLAEFLRLLARDGYRGAITVETGPEAMDAEDEVKCLAALRRALAFCREHFVR